MTTRSIISIESLKHDGTRHRLWETNEVLYHDESIFIGKNDHTIVVESNGKRWRTKEPAIFYFNRHHWFNIILLFGERHYYYCNMASPFTYENGTLTYIDYDIDIIVDENGEYQIVDEDEFEQHTRFYGYDETIIQTILEQKEILMQWIDQQKGPFHSAFEEYWYKEIERGR